VCQNYIFQLSMRGVEINTNCHRTVPLKIICLGLARTGTLSLRQALFDLNIHDVYHFTSVADNPPDATIWLRALDKKVNNVGPSWKKKDWDALLGHCMAVSDHPCIVFWEELLEVYPDAKVILTVRYEVDVWYESVLTTIWPIVKTLFLRDGTTGWKTWVWRSFVPRNDFTRMNELVHTYREGMFFEFPTRGKEFYENHNQRVKKAVRGSNRMGEGRLLVYNVKEGWKPLCRFLGMEEPAWRFPRLNDRETFQRNMDAWVQSVHEIAMRRMMLWAGGMVAIGGVVWWFLWGRR
jgi:hypothetical protein